MHWRMSSRCSCIRWGRGCLLRRRVVDADLDARSSDCPGGAGMRRVPGAQRFSRAAGKEEQSCGVRIVQGVCADQSSIDDESCDGAHRISTRGYAGQATDVVYQEITIILASTHPLPFSRYRLRCAPGECGEQEKFQRTAPPPLRTRIIVQWDGDYLIHRRRPALTWRRRG